MAAYFIFFQKIFHFLSKNIILTDMTFNIYHYLTLLAAMLCISLFFSCTSSIDLPPPPPDSNNLSSDNGNVNGSSSSNGSGSSSSSDSSSSSSSLTPPTPDFCAGETNISTYCPEINWADVKWNQMPTSSGCYYVSNLTELLPISGATLVNGTQITGITSSFPLPIDNGYYVYTSGSVTALGTAGTGKPPCSVALNCDLPTGYLYENSPISASSIATCDNGTAASSLIWIDAPAWNNPAAGTYSNISVFGKCGTFNKSAVCSGTLAVLQKPVFDKKIAFVIPNSASKGADVYFIGEIPTTNAPIEITNSGAQCDPPTVEIEGNTEEPGKIKAYVMARCGNSTSADKIDSAIVDVVPPPSLSGECKWNKNPIRQGSTAIPSGVTLNNSYGRCGTLNDGPVPRLLYGNEEIESWTGDGLALGTYTGVQTKVVCEGYTITQKGCEPLEVAACEYNPSWCENISIANVYKPTGHVEMESIGGWNTGHCFFINGASTFQISGGSQSANFKINGQKLDCAASPPFSFTTCTTGISPADGGYYIYVDQWFIMENATGGSLAPGCY